MMGIRYFNIGEMLIISKTISKVLRERRKGFIFRYLPNTDLYTILIASKQRLKTRPKPHRPLLCRKALHSITQIHNALENHTQFITMVNPFLTADEVLQEFQLTRLASYQKVRSNRQSSLESCKVNKLSVIYFAGPIECRAITSLCAAIKYYRTETLCWSTSWEGGGGSVFHLY